MIKNFVGGLTWICRDKQEHEKINVEIEFKWGVVSYHCQNEIPGTSRGVSWWWLTLTPPLRTPRPTWCRSCGAVSDCPDTEIRRVRRVSSCWCPPPGSCILHYCHLSTSASSTQPHLARPGLKQPLIHLHPGGNMMTHTLPFFLRVSTSPQCMYVDCTYYSLRFKPLDWNQTRKSLGQECTATEKNLWIIEWNRYLGFSPSLDVWI